METSEKPVPAGGPGNVNGVLYQLLWSLSTLGGFRVTEHNIVGNELDSITLVIEPSSGGDQQTISPGKRVVTQLKARSTGKAWSLQEIIRDVLPDLYLAVDLAQPNTEYQFVTESRAGRWSEVEKFFGNLPPLPSGPDVLAHLNNSDELKFGGRSERRAESKTTPFWESGCYSSRRMFEKIVRTLRERPSIEKDTYEVTCQKTWLLLRGYRFVGEQTHDGLRKAVDQWLLNRIGSADRLTVKRDSLLLDLARRACAGDARVDAASFFEKHGLDGTPLSEWFTLSSRSRDYLAGVFRRKGIDPTEDVRPTFTRDLMTEWNLQTPIVVLTGESGTGKTWHGYAALATAAVNGDIVVLVDSVQSADSDLANAERTSGLKLRDATRPHRLPGYGVGCVT